MSTIMTRSGAMFWWNLPIKGVKRKPFFVPPEVHHYYHDEQGYHFGTAPRWKIWTWADEFAKRKEKQNIRLSYKRLSNNPQKKAALIWVFYNNTQFFSGWWIYIKTLKQDYGINFRHESDPELVLNIMRKYPCGIIPVKENFREWCAEFSKQYSTKSFGGRKKQGVLKCWIEIDSRSKIKLFPVGKTRI